MAYYLSRRNEAVLQQFLPILKIATEDVILETNDPDRLVYILRNAAGTKQYAWIGNKFIISKKPKIDGDKITPAVQCKIRDVVVAVVDGIKSIDDIADLVYIVNYLIQQKPPAIRFTNAYLTESEYERLEAYCQTNNYTLRKDEKGVTIAHA